MKLFSAAKDWNITGGGQRSCDEEMKGSSTATLPVTTDGSRSIAWTTGRSAGPLLMTDVRAVGPGRGETGRVSEGQVHL